MGVHAWEPLGLGTLELVGQAWKVSGLAFFQGVVEHPFARMLLDSVALNMPLDQLPPLVVFEPLLRFQ
jgi:hypothetical protein